MAVPPTIPTSFVPRSGASHLRGSDFDFGGAFAALGYGAFVLVLIMAAGVFAYNWILIKEEAGKREQLHQAETSIDIPTVDSFIHLHDQLTEGKRLLDAHQTLSTLFNVIETLSPTTVRLSSLEIALSPGHPGSLAANGTAASFNSLAALSAALDKDGRIKNAIFSNIAVAKTGSGINFALSADMDPSLAVFTTGSSPAPAQAATSTP